MERFRKTLDYGGKTVAGLAWADYVFAQDLLPIHLGNMPLEVMAGGISVWSLGANLLDKRANPLQKGIAATGIALAAGMIGVEHTIASNNVIATELLAGTSWIPPLMLGYMASYRLPRTRQR